MYCDSFACHMTVRACEANQKIAVETYHKLLEDDQSIFELEDVEVNRMLVCGDCPCSAIDSNEVKKIFRSSLTTLLTKIENFEEYGFDPELSRQRRTEAGKVYRVRNRDRISAYSHNRRVDMRIEKLRAKIGVPL